MRNAGFQARLHRQRLSLAQRRHSSAGGDPRKPAAVRQRDGFRDGFICCYRILRALARAHRRSQRGDYDIEHFRVKPGDRLKFPSGYVYEVTDVEQRRLVLRAAPNQEGLDGDPWDLPAGRSPIGNHNKIVVSDLDENAKTARVSIEHKKRWHWWDAFNF